MNWLETGTVDVGLLYQTSPTITVELRPLIDEPLWAVAPTSAGLTADRPVSFRSGCQRR